MAAWRTIGRVEMQLALVGILGVASPVLVGAAPAATSPKEIATLEASGGEVTVIRLGLPQPPALSMPLQLDDILVTKRGRATVRFHSDGTVVRVGPDSRVQIITPRPVASRRPSDPPSSMGFPVTTAVSV